MLGNNVLCWAGNLTDFTLALRIKVCVWGGGGVSVVCLSSCLSAHVHDTSNSKTNWS